MHDGFRLKDLLKLIKDKNDQFCDEKKNYLADIHFVNRHLANKHFVNKHLANVYLENSHMAKRHLLN